MKLYTGQPRMYHTVAAAFGRCARQDTGCRAIEGRSAVRHQKARLWQPSTTTDVPLIQLARGDARNATTAPTSSGRPKRPNGSYRRMKSAIPSGSSFTRRSHEPPGKRIDPGATLLTRMLSRASCWDIAF